MKLLNKSLVRLSFTALLVGAFQAEAMHPSSAHSGEEGLEAGSRASVMTPIMAEPAVAGSGRVALKNITQAARTPLLKQRLFVPWDLENHAFSDKDARHLARDSLSRIVDHKNPIHRAMLREAYKMVWELDEDIALQWDINASTLRDFRQLVLTKMTNMSWSQLMRFSRDFQTTWNRVVTAAEAKAAQNLLQKEALQAKDVEMRTALLDIARDELMNPALFPLWRADEREIGLKELVPTWRPTTVRDIMGDILLTRGRGCFIHCLREPGLGPRLVTEILRVASPERLESLLDAISFLVEYRGVLMEPIFPADAHPVTPETQARARQLLRLAKTGGEVIALRHSVHGPALMSLDAMEMRIEDLREETLPFFLRLFPNLRHLTWSWGPQVVMTPLVMREGVEPLVAEAPDTLEGITFRYAEPVEALAPAVREGLRVEWMPEEEGIDGSAPAEADIAADRALIEQMTRAELMRLFSDESLVRLAPDTRSYMPLAEADLPLERLVGSAVMRDFADTFEGLYRYQDVARQKFYATLQTLVQPALETGSDVAQLDLSPLRAILEMQARASYRQVQRYNSGFFPWYVEKPEVWSEEALRRSDYVRLDGPYGTPPISLVGDDNPSGPVEDFTYLGETLEAWRQKVREEALPLQRVEHRSPEGIYISDPRDLDSRERVLLEPIGLFKLKEKRG